MNKSKAIKVAESETLSISDLRKMLDARCVDGMSKVNPSLTAEQAINILARALHGRDSAEIPKAWHPDPYSRSGTMKHTKDVLIVANILRECT